MDAPSAPPGGVVAKTKPPHAAGNRRADAETGQLQGRRVLVVAHDFPPVPSPQSVRAMAFVRELNDCGAEVHVLTRTRLRGLPEPPLPEGIRVWRASPGPWEAAVDAISSRRRRAGADGAPPPSPHDSTGPVRLNWKGKAIRFASHVMALLLFPDDRVAWVPSARRMLGRISREAMPDVALVMHEPAASLVLARALPALGIPWLADIADPVLAGYTPWHWRRLARRLEARTLRDAASVTVTNKATAQLLRSRHPWARVPITVLPQGFELQDSSPMGDTLPLRLVYTGRFYSFRPPGPLLDAVLAMPGVELHIAGPEMPQDVLEAASMQPDRIKLHGELDHARAIALQRSADTLVSIGNRDAIQTPGKIYEYFGIARPVLHLRADAADPVPLLLSERRRGVSCENESGAIQSVLTHLLGLKREGRLAEPFDFSLGAVEDFTWRHLGQRLAGLLAAIATRR